MRVSLKWLKEFVDLDLTVEELCERLDMTGTKVEAVHVIGEALPGVVVGQVKEKEPHPNADKLSYCRVDVGGPEELRIVCGAQNFQTGDKVPVAVVGSELPGGFTIKRAKLRGVESEGMMCSGRELGIGADHSGLLILPEEAPVGMPFSEYYGTGDVVLELEITPNRPDCLSVTGVAREAAAVLGKTWVQTESHPTEAGTPAGELVDVEIDDAELCPRYTARVISGVKVGPSPDWLVERLQACGARPVNNVVDATNFVMFELGQPLHAFDMDTLARRNGRTMVGVRAARPGETLTTLDGVKRTLAEDTLCITDADGVVALAGVMGGEATEVSEATTTVLLEAACFQTSSISRTSRRLGLISEASLRMERGVDPNVAARASDRAAAMIAELSGGTVAPGIVDVYPGEREPMVLPLRPARVNAVLGVEVPRDDVVDILSRLGLDIRSDGHDLSATVPTFRPDLDREIDLVEEVVRVWGMGRVPSTLPGGRERVGSRSVPQQATLRIGDALRGAGLHEHIGWTLADPADMQRLGWTLGPDELLVELINPMAEDQSVLRWTLLSGLLRTVARNQRRGVPNVRLYEIGTVFRTAEGRKQPKERGMVAGALGGSWEPSAWNQPEAALDFFDGKGVLETLFDVLHVGKWRLRAADHEWLQAGRSADILVGSDVIGWIGDVAPSVLDAFESAGPVTVFEMGVPALQKAAVAAETARAYRDIPRYPAVELDLALVVDDSVTAERVQQAMKSAGGQLLESVRLFDVYRGPGMPEGKKSLAFALAYRSPDRTLSADEIQPLHDKVVSKATAAVGGELRG